METCWGALQGLIGPDHLEECWIKKNLTITGPALSGFCPEAPFCLPASGGKNHAALSQRIGNLLCGVKSGGINKRNREHVEYEPSQGRPGSVRGCHHSALEVGSVEKHERCIETQ